MLRHPVTVPTRRSSLSKLVFSAHSFPFLEFDLLLKGEDVLPVGKVYESEMFVEHVAVGSRCLEVGDAHILVVITLQDSQEKLFGEAGDLLRYAAGSLETLRGRRLF